MLSNNALPKIITELEYKLLLEYKLIPFIGLETEFYLLDINKNFNIPNNKIEKINSLATQHEIILTQEKGINQYEFNLQHTNDLILLNNNLIEVKSRLAYITKELELCIDYSPKPFSDDYGSGMHLHLSIHDYITKENLLGLADINNNKILMHIIAGILTVLKSSLYWIIGEEIDEYNRLCPNFMAPISLSWGGNNRTTAIRIPDSDPKYRRIELRLPSAKTELNKVILIMLLGIIHGLHNRLSPPLRIYGNAWDEPYVSNNLYNFGLLNADIKQSKNNSNLLDLLNANLK